MYKFFKEFQLLLLGIVLVTGMILGAKIIADNISQAGITVTGSAYEIVKSDIATLRLNINTRNADKANAYTQLKNQIPLVKNYLINNGIKEDEITIEAPSNYTQNKYSSSGAMTNEIAFYNFNQTITIKSGDIEKITKLSIDAQSLLEKGININTNTPEYNYSKLADLKIKLLGEATKDAKLRAIQMLKATNNRVGKIKSVKMGVFQITAPTSNEVSNWGINDTSSKEKKVTAVANVIFEVK
ncbi:SIMPL domain-containing protein [bacterium]|nr:SIMPL domain-containing protein [bacterium]